MNIKPLIGITYELIFQIINTLIFLGILILIVYGVYCLISRLKNKNKYENRITELESKIEKLEKKIDNNKI